jgi:hypothetical protein
LMKIFRSWVILKSDSHPSFYSYLKNYNIKNQNHY